MNSDKNKVEIISLVLMLPALFLGAAGILYTVFGLEAANRLVDGMMASWLFKALFSPVVVLGGPLVAFALNAWKVFHLSAEVVHEEFVVALSIKRQLGHLLCLGVAGGLMALLMAYAFVENFRIVAR